MIVVEEQHTFDSPYLEWAGYGYTLGDAVATRAAECNWHLIITQRSGVAQVLVVGPLEAARALAYVGGAESLWIRFRIGTFMPEIPPMTILNGQTKLQPADKGRFWLGKVEWETPAFGNVDTFVERLAGQGMLKRDPIVTAVLRGESRDQRDRTIRHHFRNSTGLRRGFIHQHARARQALELLQRGYSPADTAFDLGYSDQPHLTRSLRRFYGRTPGEILSASTHLE